MGSAWGREALGRLARMRSGERGQGTVEWVGTAVRRRAAAGRVGRGRRAGARGARWRGRSPSRILCAAALADGCGDEPALIAAYGTRGRRAGAASTCRSLAFEEGSRALPVDFRRCRSTACGDGAERRPRPPHRRAAAGHRVRPRHRLPGRRRRERRSAEGATARARAPATSTSSTGLYYADSATLRGVPVAGEQGFHRDDWESVQIRIRPDGRVDQRASSHHGYNHDQGDGELGLGRRHRPARGRRRSDRRPPRERLGPRDPPPARLRRQPRRQRRRRSPRRPLHPGRRVHLIPLEPIAATSSAALRGHPALAQAGLARPARPTETGVRCRA